MQNLSWCHKTVGLEFLHCQREDEDTESIKDKHLRPWVKLSLIEILGLIKYNNIIITDFRLSFTPALSVPLVNALKQTAFYPCSLSFKTLYKHLFNVDHYWGFQRRWMTGNVINDSLGHTVRMMILFFLMPMAYWHSLRAPHKAMCFHTKSEVGVAENVNELRYPVALHCGQVGSPGLLTDTTFSNMTHNGCIVLSQQHKRNIYAMLTGRKTQGACNSNIKSTCVAYISHGMYWSFFKTPRPSSYTWWLSIFIGVIVQQLDVLYA